MEPDLADEFHPERKSKFKDIIGEGRDLRDGKKPTILDVFLMIEFIRNEHLACTTEALELSKTKKINIAVNKLNEHFPSWGEYGLMIKSTPRSPTYFFQQVGISSGIKKNSINSKASLITLSNFLMKSSSRRPRKYSQMMMIMSQTLSPKLMKQYQSPKKGFQEILLWQTSQLLVRKLKLVIKLPQC